MGMRSGRHGILNEDNRSLFRFIVSLLLLNSVSTLYMGIRFIIRQELNGIIARLT